MKFLIEAFLEKENVSLFVPFKDCCIGDEFSIVFYAVPIALFEFMYFLFSYLVSIRVIEYYL